MTDSFTETTTTSWGSRLMASLKGVLLGIVLFIAAFPLLWWNEGRTLHRVETLDEGRNMVIAVATRPVDSKNDGRLVYFSGTATTEELVSDGQFGVAESVLKLRRTVEMYQWQEEKKTERVKNLGGSETEKTTYSYKPVWSESWVDSSSFKEKDKHGNPSSMPFTSITFEPSTVKVEYFSLSPDFTSKLDFYEPYPITEGNRAEMNEGLKKSFEIHDQGYFYGDPATPQIGALRVKYSMVKPATVSVIGKQNGHRVEPYLTKNGSIALLEMGNVGADTMFATAQTDNRVTAWLIRLGGFFLMWAGLGLVFSPVKILADVVPFIGNIVGAGVGFILGLAALALSTIIIALAWLAYRPLIGLALLAAAGAIAFACFKQLRKAKPLPTAANPAV